MVAQWWELVVEAACGKEVLPNMIQAEIEQAEKAKIAAAERKRLADDFDQQHREAKKEWTAAKEVYGWDHSKTQLAALRLAELEKPGMAQWLLERALPGLEASLGLHEETLKALRLLALLTPQLTLLQRWRRAAEALRGPNHIDTIEASWHLAIQLHQAGAFQEAIDLFASIASRSSELRILAWLKQASALQDAGSSGHAELLACQAIRALAAPCDAQMQHGYGAMRAAAAQFLGELLLQQHGESVWDAHLRQQPLPSEDRSLLLEAEQLFRQALSLTLTRRATLGLVQALFQLALFDDFGARMSEVQSLLREDLSKMEALDVDIFASQCNLAFCFQLQGYDQEARAIYDQVLPGYCRWADNESKVSPAMPLSLGASTIGAACAAHNSACLDGNLSKLRWALQATRPDRRVSTCIATRLLQHLTIAGAEDEAQQLMEEFQLKKEEVSSIEDNFLALWPQRPSSRSKWRRPTTNPRRSVCCCGNARCAPSKCIAVGH